MKKYFKLLLLTLLLIIPTGCTNSDNMEDITIYTSGYPIEFVTNKLYKDYSKIYNMYPRGIDITKYNLTKKQVNDYSNSDLVIYSGLVDDNDNIVKMVNNNKKLKIIDATSRIDYNNEVNEVWINPSNLLTISQNIRNGLKEYITSKVIKDKIENNYNDLKMNISTIDADLKEMAENTNDKTLVVANNNFNFLSKYGLNIMSLDEKTNNDKNISDIKNLIKNGTVKYIFMMDNEEETDIIKSIKQEYPNIEILYIDSLNNISTKDKNEGKDYISIMNENIDKFKQELY
jgi:zinc transport system substrate-binding protein